MNIIYTKVGELFMPAANDKYVQLSLHHVQLAFAIVK
jgi:hypothetical protein